MGRGGKIHEFFKILVSYVDTISFSGSIVSNRNSVEKETQRGILAGNRTYFATISLFRSRLLSRTIKIVLYKTLIRPVVTYGAEVWTLTKKEEQFLLIFLKENI